MWEERRREGKGSGMPQLQLSSRSASGFYRITCCRLQRVQWPSRRMRSGGAMREHRAWILLLLHRRLYRQRNLLHRYRARNVIQI